jgi:molecular chaperone GrpE
VIKVKLSKKLERLMAENENIDKRFKQEANDKKETEEPEPVDYKSIDYGEGYAQQKIDELTKLLEKEKEKSLRLQADYQNLEKQTVDRINAREDKIILNFLTVYEDFIRAKDAYEKEGANVDNLNSIIKNMESILGNYDVKPIETEGRKFDPKLHEVVQEIEDDDHEEGTIVKEIAKGYIIRDEVIKYSKVCVSKKLTIK